MLTGYFTRTGLLHPLASGRHPIGGVSGPGPTARRPGLYRTGRCPGTVLRSWRSSFPKSVGNQHVGAVREPPLRFAAGGRVRDGGFTLASLFLLHVEPRVYGPDEQVGDEAHD